MNKQVLMVMVKSAVANVFLSILKITAGVFGKSNALVADGIHSLSDLSTDIVAFIGLKQSEKKADEDHPYGHGRIEYFTSLLIGLLIMYLAFMIMKDAFYAKSSTIPSDYVAYVLLVTISTKFLISRYIIQKGKQFKNNILISSGNESLSDVYTSIVVLISFVLSKFSTQFPILSYSDRVGSFLVGLFILNTGFSIFRENSQDILGRAITDTDEINEVQQIINSTPGVLRSDELHVLKFGPYHKAILSISVDGNITVIEGHEIAHKVEDAIKEKYPIIRYVTVHVNPDLGE